MTATDKDLLRDLAKEAILSAQTDARGRVFSPRDWNVWDGIYPVVQVKAPRETKNSIGRSMPPAFTTVATVLAIGTVEGNSPEEAETKIDDLERQIKNAVMRSQGILQRISQFPQVNSEQQVTAEGSRHLAEVQVEFYMEFYEEVDPLEDDEPYPLNGVDIHVDTTNVVDTAGTYADPPFPAAVTPAPRDTGPDGRDEGALRIANLQD